jgi:hypothetical protein
MKSIVLMIAGLSMAILEKSHIIAIAYGLFLWGGAGYSIGVAVWEAIKFLLVLAGVTTLMLVATGIWLDEERDRSNKE